MARSSDRFRQLRTPRTGDLFEHFGVPLGPTEPGDAPGPVIAAAACHHCGWLRPLPVRGPCPLCGGPGREDRAGKARAEPPR